MVHILYYSMTGNTKKMADVIAAALGVKATSIKAQPALPQDGLLFIGSGSYGDKHSDDMAKFLEKNDFSGRKVALFGTSGKGEGKEVQSMAEALQKKGATVTGSYYCKGKSFVVVNLGHPNADEFEGARKFAREMIRND